MKMWKKLMTTVLTAVLALVLSAGMTGTCVFAEKESYTYTVTFLAGIRGTFNDTEGLTVEGANARVLQEADRIVISGLEAGDVVSFNAPASVVLDEDSKHYVQGVRLSGRDNDTVADSVFVVDSDEDYVVAYGIRGNMTSYTVHYQDEEGKTLLDSDVFYGNAGDKPVVAYRYVEGYAPQVLGYTKTLSENAAENIFTFVYEEVIVEDIIQVVPGTGTSDNDDTPDDGGTPDDGDAPDDGDTPNDGNVPDDSDTPDDSEVPDDSDTPDDTEGSEEQDDPIVDLDDEETPLGDIDVQKDGKGWPLAGMIAAGAAAAAALVGIAVFVIKRVRN